MISLKNCEYTQKNLGVPKRQRGPCVPGERETSVRPLHFAVREVLCLGICLLSSQSDLQDL